MAHPRWRGPMTGLYNTCWWIGSISSSWVSYGCSFFTTTLSFRLPIWIQLLSSVVVCAGVFVLPESPRWLMAHGRFEEAKAVLIKYHGEGTYYINSSFFLFLPDKFIGNPEHPMVNLELKEMAAQIAVEVTNRKWWDYQELYNTRSARHRLACVVCLSIFGQVSGNSVVSYYFPVMLQTAGITDEKKQLVLNGINPVISWFGAVTGANLSDKLGRRPLMFYTLLFTSVAFAIVTAASKLGIQTGSIAATNTSIAFMYLASTIYSFGWISMRLCMSPRI